MITDYAEAVRKAFWHRTRKQWVDLTMDDMGHRSGLDAPSHAAELIALGLAKHRIIRASRGEEIDIFSVSDLGKRITGL